MATATEETTSPTESPENSPQSRVLTTPEPANPPRRRTAPSQSRSRRAPRPKAGLQRPKIVPTGSASDEDDVDTEDVLSGPGPLRGKVAAIADDLAVAGKKGAAKLTRATEADWEEFLVVAFGFLSLLFVWWLVSGSPVTMEQRESLELTEDEAAGLARPAARILARSWLNRRYGRHVLGASDYVVMAIVLVTYVERVTPYIRRKLGIARSQNTARMAAQRQRQEETNGRVVAPEGPRTEAEPGWRVNGLWAT